jgi:hypothetical protein
MFKPLTLATKTELHQTKLPTVFHKNPKAPHFTIAK